MERTTFTDKVTQWLDDELSAAEIAEFEGYLAEHPDDADTYQAVRRADSLLRTAAMLTVIPERGFTARFERRLADYKPRRAWQRWLALSLLLLIAVALVSAGAIIGGVTLLNTWATIIDMQIFYYWLGWVGQTVNQVRALIELGDVFLKIGLIAVSQPAFWVIVPVAGLLTWLWLRLLTTPPRRLSTTTNLLV